jgi:endoglucanase
VLGAIQTAQTAAAGPAPVERFAGKSLYVSPWSTAAAQAEEWRISDPVGASYMDELAAQPHALWLSDWTADVRLAVDDALTVAGGELRTLVVYGIPQRDCGAWSAGGAPDAASYRRYIDRVAAGLERRQAIVVLEPDALALDHCLTEGGKAERMQLLSYAVDKLGSNGAAVYIDAGDSAWLPADDAAERLAAAGVHRAAGIALNVSHTEYTVDEIDYAEEIRGLLGRHVHYVIDTSRSGKGPTWDNEWCNPRNRAIGETPQVVEDGGLDALLWIKRPGGSDGSCNGGPEAGLWWPEYARELVHNSK